MPMGSASSVRETSSVKTISTTLSRPIPHYKPLTLTRSDRKSTRLNSSHSQISYAVFCLKKKTYAHAHAIDLPPGGKAIIFWFLRLQLAFDGMPAPMQVSLLACHLIAGIAPDLHFHTTDA